MEKKRLRKATIEKIREHGKRLDLFLADLKGKKKHQIQRVGDEDGVVVERRKDILEVLTVHWEGLGKMSLSREDVPDVPVRRGCSN